MEQENKHKEGDNFIKIFGWAICFTIWILTSSIQGASDTIQIIINTLVPAAYAIVPTLIISVFTKRFSLIILFVISSFVLVAAIYSPRHALENYKNGIEKYDVEDYEGAIEDFDKALIKNPDFENAYFTRGTTKTLVKDYKGAIDDFTEVINLSPNNEYAFYERGFAKFLLLNYEGAIEDFSKAIEINNDYALAYEYRGYVYEKLEDFESAADDFFDAYLATDSDNPMSEVYLKASIKIKKELSEK